MPIELSSDGGLTISISRRQLRVIEEICGSDAVRLLHDRGPGLGRGGRPMELTASEIHNVARGCALRAIAAMADACRSLQVLERTLAATAAEPGAARRNLRQRQFEQRKQRKQRAAQQTPAERASNVDASDSV